MDDFNIDDILGSATSGEDLGGNSSVKKKTVSQKSKKQRVPNTKQVDESIKPGKIVACVFLGLLMSFIFFIIVGSLYTKYITYPDQEEVIYELTGAYALEKYQTAIHNQQEVTGNNYLLDEITYCNSNQAKLDFIRKIVNTVEYKPVTVHAKNVYGNVMIDRKSKETVDIPSYVAEGEEVYFSYIDYETLDFPEGYISEKLLDYDLTVDSVSYSTILVDVFCDCISETDDLPIKTDLRAPNLVKSENGYELTEDEDIYLDTLLFSSKAFADCQNRFAEEVGYILTGKEIPISEEWKVWSNLSAVNKNLTVEPYKYGKLSMLKDWCGAYYLQNEAYAIDEDGNKIKDTVKPQLGDGTLKSPASINTPVVSYVLNGEDKIPIEVTLIEFGVSEEALTWFQTKHVQNRGYNLESEIQYYYCVFKVKNLSNRELKVSDNSSLADINKNLASRTGTVFGLTDELKLGPDEEGCIESWGRSTELYKKYLIWGADFEKKIEPVWFRVLAGDLEDTSYDKGVHIINKSRLGSDADSYLESDED